MPGTTRYSATFDRPYEEEDRPASQPSNGSRRSRSQSWQANMGDDARPYTPLGLIKTPPQRSSSTDSGTSSGTEHIPTRTVSKTAVKTHNNPFQFVKVGSCPLYKKAAEQLQKVKEVKKQPDVLKEEEEWQSNLDSWKSRRRKMSEDVFRRQEEIKQFEQEEQSSQVGQKKIKTFSEMVESRANRGRTLSLCLISSPLELQEWEVQTNKSNSSHPFSEGSEENSAVNSEDEGVGEKRTFQKNLWSIGIDSSLIKNGSTNGCKAKTNEASYADSGLESISSGHRMGDTPDSCSDFSQDSGSSIDCDSPRVSGLLLNSVNILEGFNSKSKSSCKDSFTNSKIDPDVISKREMEKDASAVHKKADGLVKEDHNAAEPNANSTSNDASSVNNLSESSIDSCAPKSSSNDDLENNRFERSIESENEVFVDDFEELNSQSKVLCPKAQQTPNMIPSSKSISQQSSCNNSTKLKGASRKSGINLIKLNNADEKLNGLTKKSNAPDCCKKSSISSGSEILKSNNVDNPCDSYVPAKLTTVNCIENLGIHKDTEKVISEESKFNKEKLNLLGNLNTDKKSHRENVDHHTTSTNTMNCTEKTKICKDVKKSNATDSIENLKSLKDTNASCVGQSSSSNCTAKLKCNVQETDSPNGTQTLKSSCDFRKSGVSSETSVKKLKIPEKIKISEKNVSCSSIERKTNDSIKNSNNPISVEKVNSSCSITQKVDIAKKTPISESPKNEINSVAIKEEEPNVHSEESDLKKPKNVIRRKKKRATAKIVSMEITNENKNSSEIQKESVVSSPQINDDTLNIVFQSPSSKNKESLKTGKSPISNNSEKTALNDIPPVEKIAEEMEKLILQQLEEEERAKDLSTKLPTTDLFASPEHNLIAPPKMVEPPKEKPPPPPSVENDTPKATPLKRVNSTKRIKKEIHKRMSNFLGIEADENGICDESSVPPPPALEQILKVEVELEKETRKRLESAAEERLRLEETEIIEKEIIANLETEERQRQLFNNAEICDFMQDEDRIQKLKEERKKMENERILAETQRLRLEEEKQLRERENFIRQQEASRASSAEISAPVLSGAANLSNNAQSPNASSLCLDTKPNVSLSGIGGEGENISNSASQMVDLKNGEIKEKPTVLTKPEVPPKPLKKKEAIRKERERLRQEQEALQRDREEHRLKLLKEQDELLKNNPKSYAPNAPAPRLGPIPPHKPAYNPQLTNRIGPQPSTRENVIYTSQSYPGVQNGISGTSGCAEPALNKPSKPVSSHKKVVQNDTRAQQKEKMWSYGHSNMPVKKYPPPVSAEKPVGLYPVPPQPPAKPSRVVPMEKPEHMLSVSGRKRCSHCSEELGRGAAMIIESLQLYYHIHCFQCCVCQAQLGNGSCGTDVRVRNNKLHCHNCYSNDEAGLKFSQV